MLTEQERAVLMQMSGDVAYPAKQIARILGETWTPRLVNKIYRSLQDKGYADFGPLWSDEDNFLRGRGYWLSVKGCDIRYK